MRDAFIDAITDAIARQAPAGVAVDSELPGKDAIQVRHIWMAGPAEGSVDHRAMAVNQWIRDDEFELVVWCEDTSPNMATGRQARRAVQELIDVVETAVYGEQATIEAEVEATGIQPLEVSVSALRGPVAEPTDQGFAGFAAVTISCHGRRTGTPI